MKYNNQWLLEQIASGVSFKYLFFWGHRPSKDGSISASCFSQWWEAPFSIDGLTYRTAEHWMMASKAAMFQDDTTRAEIIYASTPAEAKMLGRKVAGFDTTLWDARKGAIVAVGNYYKFLQHPALSAYLLQTGDRIIVEASPVDPVWGIGMAADHPRVHDPACWRGENLLGYALMEVRDRLAGRNNL
jgi:ribA/ribD-fused uncharacterized protein